MPDIDCEKCMKDLETLDETPSDSNLISTPKMATQLLTGSDHGSLSKKDTKVTRSHPTCPNPVAKPARQSALPKRNAARPFNAPGLADLTGIPSRDQVISSSNPAPADLELDRIQVVSAQVHSENETYV